MVAEKTYTPLITSLPFSKVQGIGNDFVLVTEETLGGLYRERLEGKNQADATKTFKAFLSELTRTVCNRHRGIGADGLIVAIRKSYLDGATTYCRTLKAIVNDYADGKDADYSWVYVNSDGSYATMCGNGLRCLTLFMLREGWLGELKAPGPTFAVSTEKYPVSVQIVSYAPDLNGQMKSAVVKTRLAAAKIEFVKKEISLAGGAVLATSVDMGNPHCVIFDCAGGGKGMIDWGGYPLDMPGGPSLSGKSQPEKKSSATSNLLALSHEIQSLSLFPNGVNVEWVHLEAEDRVKVYVVERGCGPTLACASGAAAVVAAGVKEGLLKSQCCVILPGGELSVTCSDDQDGDPSGNYIELTGDAEFVFSGCVPVADITLGEM